MGLAETEILLNECVKDGKTDSDVLSDLGIDWFLQLGFMTHAKFASLPALSR